MRKRFSSLLAVSFVLCGLLAPVSAQAPDQLPTCQDWTGRPLFYPSPSIVADNTLLAVGGSPPGTGFTTFMYKSVDRGLTWQILQSPETGWIYFSSSYAADRAFAVVRSPPSRAHISQDGGLTWRTVDFPRPAANAFALGDAQHLYAGYGREIPPDQAVPMELLVSSDGGGTWQTVNMGGETNSIAVSPVFGDDHTLLIALGGYHWNGGIVKSTDAGLTWHAADSGIALEGLGMDALRFSPAYAVDRTMFSVDDVPGDPVIYKSTEGGAHWQVPGDLQLNTVTQPALLISPRFAVDRTLWFVSYYVGAISRNGGQTWTPISQPLHLQAATEYCLPSGRCGVELIGVGLEKAEQMEDDKYYAYRSFDYGQTWQCLEDPTPPRELPKPVMWLPLINGMAGVVVVAGCWRLRPGRNGRISA